MPLQGVSGCDAEPVVTYDCGAFAAHKVKLGVGRGIDLGPVETPLKISSVCKSHSPLPAPNETVVSASVTRLSLELEELQIQEEEIRLKRKRLEYMKQLEAASRSVSRQPSPVDLMEVQKAKPKTDDNLAS